MKNILLLLFCSTISTHFAIDRFVNPNLSQGNGTTIFTTITAAVAAAENGDRIIVVSSTHNEAELTIDKSLQIMPQMPGTIINFDANVIISNIAGLKLEIIGLNLGMFDFKAINNGVLNNPSSINLINVSCNNILIDKDYINSHIIDSNITNEIIIRSGNVIKSSCDKLFVYDGPDSNLSFGKIIISNNNISKVLQIYNDDMRFIISNNILHDLYITDWNKNIDLSNEIHNNNFISKENNCRELSGSAPRVYFSVLGKIVCCSNYFSDSKVSTYNIIFTSNVFDSLPFYPNPSSMYSRNSPQFSTKQNRDIVRDTYDKCKPVPEGYDWSKINSIFPNQNSLGYFEWSFNHEKLPKIINNATSISFTNIESSIELNNTGNPKHKYYNIDLSVNDRGINGGPYSQLNYNAANQNNSRAFIFDLEMPADLFPGQNVEIKAKGYHKN